MEEKFKSASNSPWMTGQWLLACCWPAAGCWLLLLLPGLLLPGWLAAARWRENYDLAADSGFHSSAH